MHLPLPQHKNNTKTQTRQDQDERWRKKKNKKTKKLQDKTTKIRLNQHSPTLHCATTDDATATHRVNRPNVTTATRPSPAIAHTRSCDSPRTFSKWQSSWWINKLEQAYSCKGHGFRPARARTEQSYGRNGFKVARYTRPQRAAPWRDDVEPQTSLSTPAQSSQSSAAKLVGGIGTLNTRHEPFKRALLSSSPTRRRLNDSINA